MLNIIWNLLYNDRRLLDQLLGGDEDPLVILYRMCRKGAEKEILAAGGSKEQAYELLVASLALLWHQVRTGREIKSLRSVILSTVLKMLGTETAHLMESPDEIGEPERTYLISYYWDRQTLSHIASKFQQRSLQVVRERLNGYRAKILSEIEKTILPEKSDDPVPQDHHLHWTCQNELLDNYAFGAMDEEHRTSMHAEAIRCPACRQMLRVHDEFQKKIHQLGFQHSAKRLKQRIEINAYEHLDQNQYVAMAIASLILVISIAVYFIWFTEPSGKGTAFSRELLLQQTQKPEHSIWVEGRLLSNGKARALLLDTLSTISVKFSPISELPYERQVQSALSEEKQIQGLIEKTGSMTTLVIYFNIPDNQKDYPERVFHSGKDSLLISIGPRLLQFPYPSLLSK